MGKSDHIRRAERKEEEARHLLREAAYLRNLAKRLADAAQTEKPSTPERSQDTREIRHDRT